MFRDPLEGLVNDKPLVHYGTKGMKWGVRKDGSRTAGGTKQRTSAGKTAKGLSDADLKARVSRLNLERQYTTLIGQEKKRERSTAKKGSDEVSKLVKDAGKEGVKETAKWAGKKGVKIGLPIVVEAVATVSGPKVKAALDKLTEK